MSVSVRCVECYYKLLNRTLYTYYTSVRYLPRWKHRRPVNVIESEVSDEEKKIWKLNVEREIKPVGNSSESVINSKLFHDQSITNELRESDNKQGSLAHFAHKNISDVSKSSFSYSSKQSGFASKWANTDDITESPKISNFEHKIRKSEINEKDRRSRIKTEDALKLKFSASKLGVPVFTDLESNDTLLSKYMTNVKSKKRREKKGLALLEGKRLIKDAVDAGIIPEAVFFSRIGDLKSLDLPENGIKIYKITYKQIALWSDVETPQGVIAFIKLPLPSRQQTSSLPLSIICDNVRDPGNLGTILRTCAGIGCNKVFLTKGCADLWEPKVLRAAAGAHFRLSVENSLEWSHIMHHISSTSCVFIAENNLSHKTKSSSHSPCDQQDHTSMSDENNCRENNTTLDSVQSFKNNINLLLPPVIPYYAFDYSSVESLVLIIGGETEGVSSEAYKMVSQSGGVLLNVPLSNGVESLNVGTALGVIAFEMKKQLLVASNREQQKSETLASNV